jgi:Tfp pilus assembly protein PilO
MKQDSKRLTSIMLSGLLIVAALVAYFEFIIPSYSNLQDEKGKLTSESNLYQSEQQIASSVKDLLNTYKGDSSSSQLVALALPTGPNLASALAQIYGIAASAGVNVQGTGISIQAIQSVQPASSAAPAGTIAGAAAAGSVVKPTGTVSIQIKGAGSYEGFKLFLQGLETNIRIFDVSTISLQPSAIAATKTQAGNADMFNFNVTVVTYYQGH